MVAKKIGIRLTLLFLFCGLIAVSASSQTIRYVNVSASGANDGTSWTNAFTSLQSALDVAVGTDQIWVAKGTYKPSKDVNGSSTPTDPRAKTFYLKDGVRLYGGFAGSEATLGARNITANPTILSGDIDGNDGADFAGNSENNYHVVIAYLLTTTTVLDGFIISGANSDNIDEVNVAGIKQAHAFGGGLLANQNGNKLILNNCVFTSNAAWYGGGVYNNQSLSSMNDCVFAGNKVVFHGGGIYNEGSPVTINNCVMINNRAYNGGGIHVYSSTPTILNTTIIGNDASNNGGGVFFNFGSASISMKNSIVWGNTGAGTQGIAVASGSTPTVAYCNVQGSFAGIDNINADPLFDNVADADGVDDTWGTADDGLHLRSTSPAANTGNNADVLPGWTTDIVGSARVQNTTVNMGAYETVKLEQVISGLPTTATKTYGDADYTLSATGGASGNPVVYTSSNTAVATISGSTVTIVGAGTATITASQAGNITYSSAKATQTLTVNKRAISIKANDATKAVGETKTFAGNEYSITSGSLASGDAISSVSFSSTGAASGAAVGTYDIVPSATAGLSTTNYTVTYVNGTLTVNGCIAPSITTDPVDQIVCPSSNVSFTVAASGSGLSYQWKKDGADISGANAVTYSISSVTAGHAANYTVEVSNGCGSVTSTAANLSVNVKTAITADPVAETVCEGGTATFKVTAMGSNLTYQWYKGSTALSGKTASTLDISGVATADADNYHVVVTGDCGNVTSSSVALTVWKTTAITTDPVSQVVCEGENVTFTGSASGTGVSYKWRKDGIDIPGATSASYTISGVTAANNGSYILVASSACSGGTSSAATLTVNAIPVAPSISTTDPTTFCDGGSAVLISSATSGNQWYKDGSAIAGATSQTYTATEGGNYTVQTTQGGCTSPASAGTTITVTPVPAAPTVTVGGATDFCAGGNVVLTSSATMGNQWFDGTTLLSGETGQTFTATTSGNYHVQVTTSGCTSASSTSTAVTVNPIPAAPTVSASGATTICAGGSVVLTSSASAANQWYNGSTLLVGETGQTYTATTTGNYSVQVTNAGCTSAASAVTTVTVNALPVTPTITTSGSTTFCSGGSVVLTSSAALGNQWFKDGSSIAGATGQTYTATETGDYTVQVSETGCASPMSLATTVVVNATPAIPTITQNGNILTSSATSGNQWYLGGAPITGATGQTQRAQAKGIYTVEVSNGSCSNVSAPHNYVATRVEEPGTWNGDVVLYPNPATTTLVVKNQGSRKLLVQLYDGFGRKVHQSTLQATQGRIDVQGLSAGIYQVIITDQATNKTISQSIIKL